MLSPPCAANSPAFLNFSSLMSNASIVSTGAAGLPPAFSVLILTLDAFDFPGTGGGTGANPSITKYFII